MTDGLNWSEDQWNRVRQTVHDEAMRARVAASFLPLFGPLPGDTQAVPRNRMEPNAPGTPGRLSVNDYDMLRLSTLSVNVYVKNAQLADPELTSALMMFRRAAEIVSRIEDMIVFNGQGGVGKGPSGLDAVKIGVPDVYQISGGGKYEGLIAEGAENKTDTDTLVEEKECQGAQVFQKVVEAIKNIESKGFGGPFACVMGNDLFRAVTTPVTNSMVLPRDSILPFLDGPLIRSSAVGPRQAVVIGLLGQPVELVVPSDISVRFLQTTADGENVFRVQQKFVLRVKEADAISTISL